MPHRAAVGPRARGASSDGRVVVRVTVPVAHAGWLDELEPARAVGPVRQAIAVAVPGEHTRAVTASLDRAGLVALAGRIDTWVAAAVVPPGATLTLRMSLRRVEVLPLDGPTRPGRIERLLLRCYGSPP